MDKADIVVGASYASDYTFSPRYVTGFSLGPRGGRTVLYSYRSVGSPEHPDGMILYGREYLADFARWAFTRVTPYEAKLILRNRRNRIKGGRGETCEWSLRQIFRKAYWKKAA